MMRRTAFRRKDPPPSLSRVRQWSGPAPTPRAPAQAVPGPLRAIVSLPKDRPARSLAYRRWVATLACAHCRRAGPSQCAHADAGKGLAIKSTDAACFPLCADAPGRRGCHTRMGASGEFGQEGRRALEVRYGAETEALARATGKWPRAWE